MSTRQTEPDTRQQQENGLASLPSRMTKAKNKYENAGVLIRDNEIELPRMCCTEVAVGAEAEAQGTLRHEGVQLKQI